MKLIGWMAVVCVIGAGGARGEGQADMRDPSVPRERFVCAFGDSRRLIDIYRLASGGPRGECRVDYTRNGVTTRVWSAKGDYAYCVKKAVGLVTTLSKGHFTCKPQTAEPAGESPAR
jgi:hypothetical protein